MNNVKKLRKAHGMTQSELAKKLHVNQTAVSQWETDRCNPNVEIAHEIANMFGVSVSYVLGDIEGESRDDELNEYLEYLRTRPDMRMIFSLTSKAKKEDVEKLVPIIEAYVKSMCGEE